MATSTKPETLTDNEGNRIHASWFNTGEIALAIMRGDHDDELAHIQNACKTRTKVRYRKGQRFVLKGTRSVDLEGKECVVTKVNQKSISVGVGKATTDQWGTTYDGGEYNVSPGLLHPIGS